MKQRKRLSDLIARQNNTRGMGLARDVRAGQAKPVPSQAQKQAITRLQQRMEWAKGRRRA